MPAAACHPDRAFLEAFALGRLDGPEMDRVEVHLRQCAACGQIVQEAPVDRLVALLRRVGPPPARG